MRVREWYLSGHAKQHRQTILLSSFASAEANALFNRACVNIAGKVRLKVDYKVSRLTKHMLLFVCLRLVLFFQLLLLLPPLLPLPLPPPLLLLLPPVLVFNCVKVWPTSMRTLHVSRSHWLCLLFLMAVATLVSASSHARCSVVSSKYCAYQAWLKCPCCGWARDAKGDSIQRTSAFQPLLDPVKHLS